MKFIVVLAFVGIVAALAGAGMLMVRKRDGAPGQGADKRMARALALRVAISVGLFVFILVGWQLGWIQPTGLPLMPTK